eukprot:Hpha_TRINITY_DN15644_c2_g1::TRINITY_DN15644_c2_g1_i1::g.97657::m.97657
MKREKRKHAIVHFVGLTDRGGFGLQRRPPTQEPPQVQGEVQGPLGFSWRHRLHTHGPDIHTGDVLNSRGVRVTVGKSAAQLRVRRRRYYSPGRDVRTLHSPAFVAAQAPETPTADGQSPMSAASRRLVPGHRAVREQQQREAHWLLLVSMFGHSGCLLQSINNFGELLENCRATAILGRLLLPLLRRRMAARRKKKQREIRRRKRAILTPSPEELRKAKFFSNWSVSALEEVSRRMQHVYVQPGEAVFYEGDPADAIYYVSSGAVEMFFRQGRQRGKKSRRPAHGARGTLSRPGVVIGEAGLLAGGDEDSRLRNRTAIAVEESDLFRLPASIFERLWELLPPEVTEVMHECSNERRVRAMRGQPLTAEAMARCVLLRGLDTPVTSDVYSAMASLAEPLCLRTGARLVEEGTPCTHMYFVVAGELSALKAIGGKRRDRLLSCATSTKASQVFVATREVFGAQQGAHLRDAVRVGLTAALKELPQSEMLLGAAKECAKDIPVTQDKWLEWCEALSRGGVAKEVFASLEASVQASNLISGAKFKEDKVKSSSGEPGGSYRRLRPALSFDGGRPGQVLMLEGLFAGAEQMLQQQQQQEQQQKRGGHKELQESQGPKAAGPGFFELTVEKANPGRWLGDTVACVIEGAPAANSYIANVAVDLWAIDHVRLATLLRDDFPPVWDALCRGRGRRLKRRSLAGGASSAALGKGWTAKSPSKLMAPGFEANHSQLNHKPKVGFVFPTDGCPQEHSCPSEAEPQQGDNDLVNVTPDAFALLPADRAESEPDSEFLDTDGKTLSAGNRVQTPDGWGELGERFTVEDPQFADLAGHWWVRLDSGMKKLFPVRAMRRVSRSPAPLKAGMTILFRKHVSSASPRTPGASRSSPRWRNDAGTPTALLTPKTVASQSSQWGECQGRVVSSGGLLAGSAASVRRRARHARGSPADPGKARIRALRWRGGSCDGETEVVW